MANGLDNRGDSFVMTAKAGFQFVASLGEFAIGAKDLTRKLSKKNSSGCKVSASELVCSAP